MMSDKERREKNMRLLIDIGLVSLGAILGVVFMAIVQVGSEFEREMKKHH